MQRCSLNNAWRMLLSRFNNTCWIHNVDEYRFINSCPMLTNNNSCYNVVGTRVDNSSWKKLDVCQRLNNDCWTWTIVNNGLLTTVVDRVQHASTTLQQVVDNINQVVHFCACMVPFLVQCCSQAYIVSDRERSYVWLCVWLHYLRLLSTFAFFTRT